MSDFVLMLGGVSFRDFEIPSSIRNLGGTQEMQTHKYGGGERTVDAFGADDASPKWSGIFFDATAEARCQQLDAMRKAGAPVDLTWSSFSYQVVIKSFLFDFERFYQIPYEIELEVVSDNTQPVTDDSGDDAESEMQGDLDDANTYAGELNDPALNSDIDTVNSDVAGGSSLSGISMLSITGMSVPNLKTLAKDVGKALGQSQSLLGQYDTGTDTLGASSKFASGLSPSAMMANLNALQPSTMNLANAHGSTNSLQRFSNDIATIAGAF